MTITTLPRIKNHLADISPSVIRMYIDAQTCWICGKGGWVALSQHLVKKHGLPAQEVRELAYMFKRERLISPELSERLSRDTLKKFGDKIYHLQKGDHIPNKVMSSRAKDVLRKRIREIRPTGPMPEEVRQKLSRLHKAAFEAGRIPWNKLARLKRVHKQRSLQAKNFWAEFKKLPLEQQKSLSLSWASSRRKRVTKLCVVCGAGFEVIPSHSKEAVTCGSPECKRANMSIKATGRRHTVESKAKMSRHARERHVIEGGLFGRPEAK